MRGLVFLEQRLETPDHFRLFPVEVAALGEVVPQIVESAGELVCYVAALLLEPVRLAGMGSVAVAVAAGGINQHPVAFTKGEAPIAAVQHGGFANGVS